MNLPGQADGSKGRHSCVKIYSLKMKKFSLYRGERRVRREICSEMIGFLCDLSVLCG